MPLLQRAGAQCRKRWGGSRRSVSGKKMADKAMPNHLAMKSQKILHTREPLNYCKTLCITLLVLDKLNKKNILSSFFLEDETNYDTSHLLLNKTLGRLWIPSWKLQHYTACLHESHDTSCSSTYPIGTTAVGVVTRGCEGGSLAAGGKNCWGS